MAATGGHQAGVCHAFQFWTGVDPSMSVLLELHQLHYTSLTYVAEFVHGRQSREFSHKTFINFEFCLDHLPCFAECIPTANHPL